MLAVTKRKGCDKGDGKRHSEAISGAGTKVMMHENVRNVSRLVLL